MKCLLLQDGNRREDEAEPMRTEISHSAEQEIDFLFCSANVSVCIGWGGIYSFWWTVRTPLPSKLGACPRTMRQHQVPDHRPPCRTKRAGVKHRYRLGEHR